MSGIEERLQTLKSEFDRIKARIKANKVVLFGNVPDLKEIKASSCGMFLLALTGQKIAVFGVGSKVKVQEIVADVQVKSFCEVNGTVYVCGKGVKRCKDYLKSPSLEIVLSEDVTSMAVVGEKLFFVAGKSLSRMEEGIVSESVEISSPAAVLAANLQIVVTAFKTNAVIYNHDLIPLTKFHFKEDYSKLQLFDSDILVAGGGKKTMQIYDYGKKTLYNYKMLNQKAIMGFALSEEMNLLACIDTDISFFNVNTYKDEAKLKLGDEKKKFLSATRSICFAQGGNSVFFSLGPMVYSFNIVESYKFSQTMQFNSEIKEISYNGRLIVKTEKTFAVDLATKSQELMLEGNHLYSNQGVFTISGKNVLKDGIEVPEMAHLEAVVKVECVKGSIVSQAQDLSLNVLTTDGYFFKFPRSDYSEFIGVVNGYFFFKCQSWVSLENTEPLNNHHRILSFEGKGSDNYLSLFKKDNELKADAAEFKDVAQQVVEIWTGMDGSFLCSSRKINGNLILFNKTPQIAAFKDWTLSIYDALDTENYITVPCNDLLGDPIYFNISSDDQFFFVATTSALGICSLYDYKYLGSIYYGTIDKILVLDNIILITVKDVLYIYPNPFDKDAEYSLLIPENFSLKYWIDLGVLIDWPKLGKYESYMNSMILLPVCQNLLHLFTHFSSHEGIKKALKEGCSYIRSTKMMSPLKVVFEQKTSNLIEYFLKAIPRYLEIDENVLHRIENDLVQLNKVSTSKLLLLYNSILQTPKQRLPKFGIPVFRGQVTKLCNSRIINPKEYIKKSTDLSLSVNFSSSLPLTFKVSGMRLPLKFGTRESLEFLDSLNRCEEQDVLTTPIVRSILYSKWGKVWYWTLIQSILILSILLMLSLYIFSGESSRVFFYTIQVLNLVNLVLECLQMSVGFQKYIRNFLNVLDFLRICFVLILCFEIDEYYEAILLAYIVMFTWIKQILYLRIFDKTRYFIYILKSCTRDILPFLVILFYLNFTFAVTFERLDTVKDTPNFKYFIDAWVHSYTLNFNSFNKGIYKDYKEWAVFLIATMTNPLILMNMIIALLNNTYTMVKEKADVADMRELAEMILEFESMLFWRRNADSKQYVQICTSSMIGTNKTYDIKTSVKQILNQVVQTTESLESFSIHNQESLQTINAMLNKVTDEFSLELEKLENNLSSDYQVLIKRFI